VKHMPPREIFRVYIERKCVRLGRKRCEPSLGGSPAPKNQQKLSPELKLYRRAKRVHSKLRLILSNIYPRPFWFITTTFPDYSWVKALKLSTPLKTQSLLDRLHRAFKYKFPKGYLVWSIEYKNGTGVHVHYACRTKTKISKKEVEKWFLKKWHSICDFDDEDAVFVEHYDHKTEDGVHDNYLTTDGKLKNKAKLIKNFGKQYVFGVVNRENMPVHETSVFSLAETQVDVLKRMLIKDIIKQRDKVLTLAIEETEKNAKINKLRIHYEMVKSDYFRHYCGKGLRKRIVKTLEEMESLNIAQRRLL
jgi:hypothetical protein